MTSESRDTLGLDRLPMGEISRFWLTITHDGLGRPIQVPVIAARGVRPGPVFGLTAAVHGDELNGIPVIHRLFEWLDPNALRGTLVAVPVVSVPAFRRKLRRFPDGDDLNHEFPGHPEGPETQVYAYRFVEKVMKHLDIMVDLHTASRGRVNSLYVRADMSDPTAASMARLQRPQIILDNPPSDGTLRGSAAALGIPAITVEVGDPQRFQPLFIKRGLSGLKAILADTGLTRKRPPKPLPAPIICARSSWLRTDTGGLLEVFPEVATMVREGEVVARIKDVFGHQTAEYRAPHDGIVIGKSVDPVADTGARVLHLGVLREGQSEEIDPTPLDGRAIPLQGGVL